MTSKFPMYLDYGIKIVLLILLFLAVFGSIYFLTTTLECGGCIKETSILTLHDVDYECTFYNNGDMICKGVNDVNVGAGRISP